MKIFGMVTTKASWEYTSYAVKSFFRNTKLDEEDRLYLIDNDFGFEEEASWFSPGLQILKNESPQGFSANMNKVLRLAKEKACDFYILHNDIIFTSEWILPLLEVDTAIVSSISNAHTDFNLPGFEWKEVVKLNQYLGNEAKLKEIVLQHKAKAEGYKKMLSAPFFCLKIPKAVYETVGELDESFQIAGFEDHDYCLRAYQAGFEVKYAKRSLLLHFNGKSTWAGAERSENTTIRKAGNQALFEKKWGETLRKLCENPDPSLLSSRTDLQKLFQEQNYKELVEKLCPN